MSKQKYNRREFLGVASALASLSIVSALPQGNEEPPEALEPVEIWAEDHDPPASPYFVSGGVSLRKAYSRPNWVYDPTGKSPQAVLADCNCDYCKEMRAIWGV